MESYLEGVHQIEHEVLGKGSYGVVIVAEWMGVKVAVKRVHDVLLPDNLEMNTVKKKAEDEAKLLQELRHPNLIQCFGRYYDDRGRLCIVMELMHKSLADLLKQTAGPLSSEKVNDIGSEISSALRYLHSMNVSHRDITPNNILLTASGRAKLSDLGGAKHILHVQLPVLATQQPGTPMYMPPEAMEGSWYAPGMVDVYSLGVVLLEMSSGVVPKPEQNLYRPHNNDCNSFYRVPEEERRKKCFSKIAMTNPVRAIILECLHDNPSKRPSSIQIQEWFLQMKKNQLPAIHLYQPHYDDIAPLLKSHTSAVQTSYVNLIDKEDREPKDTTVVDFRVHGPAVTKKEQVSTTKQGGRRRQPWQNTSDKRGYVPIYIDGFVRDAGENEGYTEMVNPRERASTQVDNHPIKPQQNPRDRSFTRPEKLLQYPLRQKSPTPQQKAVRFQQNPGVQHIQYDGAKTNPFNPPLPSRPGRDTPQKNETNEGIKQAGNMEDTKRTHVYESIDGTSLSASVLQTKKKSKKSAALQFGEKELLVTYYKDAGSSLPAHNTRGESGNVHEDDVTIIDPIHVPHIPEVPQGILYRILTSNKHQPLQTGIKSGKLQITYSGQIVGSTDTLLNMKNKEIVAIEESSAIYPYFQIDLGAVRLVQLEGYRLQCSELGKKGRPQEWEVHVSLNEMAWMSVAHDIWEKEAQTACYWSVTTTFLGRFVKIIQIGPNKKGNKKFCLSGIELYGKIYSSVAEEMESE